jgi:hypothetical protein
LVLLLLLSSFLKTPSPPGYTVLAMSPGHVATDMGNADMSNAGGRAAPLTVDMSIDGMLATTIFVNSLKFKRKFDEMAGTQRRNTLASSCNTMGPSFPGDGEGTKRTWFSFTVLGWFRMSIIVNQCLPLYP